MKTLFQKKANRGSHVSQLQMLVNTLQSTLNGSSSVNASQIARTALSLESANDNSLHSLNAASEDLSASITAIMTQLGLEKGLTYAQESAASIAGIMAGDFRGFLNHKSELPMVSSMENMVIVQAHGVTDSVQNRSFSLEAYDERENRNAAIYSIAYNMQAARQDEFGETFFPTLTMTPDNAGFGITVNLMMVFDAIERKVSGTFEDFQKKNIIRAVADASVLRKEQTRVVPVYRAQSADKFYTSATVPSHTIVLEGESITTAPIAVGKKFDLIGLSQTDALVATGLMDMTDTLDPTINLQNVYVTFGADVLKFNVLNVPLSNFTYSVQNNYRVMTLNFATTSVLINKNTKKANGGALVELAGVVTDDLIVRVELALTGTINIETGEGNVYGNAVSAHSIQNNAGEHLDMTAAPALAVATIVNGGAINGIDIQAYRTNVNRRQRGQIIDVTKFTQLYNVPLRSPITTIHPTTTDGTTDASDVQALITATRIRTSNEAVTALMNAAALMNEYVDARDLVGNGPEVLGTGRFFVRPTFSKETVDMTAVVNSLTSIDRPAAIQAAIVNKLRDHVYRAYRDSEYKAAADALEGGISKTPTVIIGTDPVLARYLTVTGDLRTLGNEFDVRIVSTLDTRVIGKIYVAFSTFDENRNVAPNPLNFGNMIWGPELVLTANISRGNTLSKETVVQPRYLFVVHCPIMIELTVLNVPDVLNKVSIDFNAV